MSEAAAPAPPRGPLLFGELFFGLRGAGLRIGVGEWMALMEALARGAIGPDLGEFYTVARALLVKDVALFDLFDQVFAAVFGDGVMPVALREDLLAWLEKPLPPPGLSDEELAAMERLPLDELRKLLEERLREQTERHDGGNYWIGTGGTSPLGHGGRNPAGIRIGGAGGTRSAVEVAAERRYRDYRSDRVLDTRAIAVALRKLRRLARRDGEPELDVEASIEATCREAGELALVFRPPRANDARVLLLMDAGGSMDPYSLLVDQLFSAAKGLTHWKKLEAFFFHNCPYAHVYGSFELGERLPTAELVRDRPKETYLVVVGDASMAPHELVAEHGSIDPFTRTQTSGLGWLQRLRQHFVRAVWLNPLPPSAWRNGYTIQLVRELFPMYPLTLDGLDDAIAHLVKKQADPPPRLDLDDLVVRRKPWSMLY